MRVEINQPELDRFADLIVETWRGEHLPTIIRALEAETPVKTGRARASHVAKATRRVGNDYVLEIVNEAPYSLFPHQGRKAIVAKPGRMLRFQIGGEVFYRKRVGPAKANPWMVRGFRRAGFTRVQHVRPAE